MKARLAPAAIDADDAALDQQVGVLLHQQPVLERARLGLVGVAAQVLVHRALGDEARLLAHREAGAAATAQARTPRARCSTSSWLHVEQRLARGAVAAEALVHVHRVQAGLVDALARLEDLHLRHPSRAPVPGQHLAALAERRHQLVRVVLGQRAHVAAVHGRHRRHVARAEALELAHLDALEALVARLLGDRVVDVLRVAQVAGHAGAHVHVAARRPARCAACRRRWPPRTGRRA